MKLYMFRTVLLPIIRSLFAVHSADELPETYRVSCRNKFEKLMHLIGFIIDKFVTIYGHMNVKKLHMFTGVRYKTVITDRSLGLKLWL